jgi:hypothetical protein
MPESGFALVNFGRGGTGGFLTVWVLTGRCWGWLLDGRVDIEVELPGTGFALVRSGTVGTGGLLTV